MRKTAATGATRSTVNSKASGTAVGDKQRAVAAAVVRKDVDSSDSDSDSEESSDEEDEETEGTKHPAKPATGSQAQAKSAAGTKVADSKKPPAVASGSSGDGKSGEACDGNKIQWKETWGTTVLVKQSNGKPIIWNFNDAFLSIQS